MDNDRSEMRALMEICILKFVFWFVSIIVICALFAFDRPNTLMFVTITSGVVNCVLTLTLKFHFSVYYHARNGNVDKRDKQFVKLVKVAAWIWLATAIPSVFWGRNIAFFQASTGILAFAVIYFITVHYHSNCAYLYDSEEGRRL